MTLSLQTMYDLPYDDEETLKEFAKDNLTGIFQFEGRATRSIMKKIYSGTDNVPDFMTLADVNALSRPGSLISGMTAEYIDVARGKAPRKIHPVVDDILSETNNCLVYQEQVMQIGSRFGGLSDHEIGRLRKIIGAKQAGGAFEEFWIKFRDGARDTVGADEALSREVWDYMAASASYLFNIAHAISYALVAYWCMYLKVHYPAEFYAASLKSASKKSKTKGKIDPQLPLLQEATANGLTVSPPHPRLSGVSWEPNEHRTGVIGGFTQIPGVGEKTAERMLEARDKSTSSAWDGDSIVEWSDFVPLVAGYGDKAAEKARDLCSKPDPFGIQLTDSATYTLRSSIQRGEVPLAEPDATSASIPSQVDEQVVYIGHVISVKKIDVINEMRQRKNMTTDEVIASLRQPHLATKGKIICVDEAGGEVHLNISRYLFPELEPELDDIDLKKVFVVHAIGQASNNSGPAIQVEDMTTIEIEDS